MATRRRLERRVGGLAGWLPGKTFVRKTGRAAADTLNFIFQIVPLKISHLIVAYT